MSEVRRYLATIHNMANADGIAIVDPESQMVVLASDYDRDLAEMRRQVADYEEVLADHRRLVREMDVALNGDGAAKQASLCDIVSQVEQRPSSLVNFVPRTELDRLTAQLSEAREKLDLAMWALVGGTYWLGRSIKRGTAEYVVVKATSPYGGAEVVEESYHVDPWESLKLARTALATTEPRDG